MLVHGREASVCSRRLVLVLLFKPARRARAARSPRQRSRDYAAGMTTLYSSQGKKAAEPGCKGRGLRKHAGCRGLVKTALQSCLVCFDT